MSGIDPKFRQLKQFHGTDGNVLGRQLSDLEGNVSDALKQIADQATVRLSSTNTKTTDYDAALDEMVIADGTFRVRLPVATAKNQGRTVCVVRKSGTVTVFASSGLVQGASTDTLSAPGAYTYTSTGVDWWRAGTGSTSVTSVTAGTGLAGGGTGDVTLAIDSTVLTTSSLGALAEETQAIRLLLWQLVRLELGFPIEQGMLG